MFLPAILIFLSVFLCSCKGSKNNPEKVIYFLKDIKSYSCNLQITTINDKQRITTIAKQLYSNKYGYRFEINNERVLLYIGDKIYVEDLNNKCSYVSDRSFDSLYSLSFIGEYIGMLYTNEEIKNTFKTENKINYQIISLTIPGNNRNLDSAELYVNLENNIPERLIIYNRNKKEKVEILYENFIVNPKINEEIFDVKSLH